MQVKPGQQASQGVTHTKLQRVFSGVKTFNCHSPGFNLKDYKFPLIQTVFKL